MRAARLDEALVARGLSQSRSRARDQVLRGLVRVNGVPARKPSQSITPHDGLAIDDNAQHYVSRAASKLLHGLDHFGVVVEGLQCLDLGASTGGFTQVLLERGATHVTAVDVGHGQMVEKLRCNPRVTLYEGLNARDLKSTHVSDHVALIVCDVSFISLKLALPPALSLVHAGCQLLALIKPQFEVGKDHIGKGGIVTDDSQHKRVCDEVAAMLVSSKWSVHGITSSPIAGGDGNREFLLVARSVG